MVQENEQKQTASSLATTPGLALRRAKICVSQRKWLLTKQAFPDRIHTGKIIAWASTNHQVERAPLVNLREKHKRSKEEGNGNLDSGVHKVVWRVQVLGMQAWLPECDPPKSV